MNIFALSPVPEVAAKWHCDKHVPKMIVESAQMLSTAHRVLDGILDRRPSKSGKTRVKYWELGDDREDILYKAVHVGHPCTVWTMESLSNYQWHYKHFIALCDEYKYRYNKTHSSDTKLRNVLSTIPDNIPTIPQTEFKLAMKSNPECMFEDKVTFLCNLCMIH